MSIREHYVPKWTHVKYIKPPIWRNGYRYGYKGCPKRVTLVGMVIDNVREQSDFSGAVAAQVRAERAAHEMTQVDLAEASGIARSTLVRIEKGTRVADATQLHRIMTALGVSMTEFFQRVEERL